MPRPMPAPRIVIFIVLSCLALNRSWAVIVSDVAGPPEEPAHHAEVALGVLGLVAALQLSPRECIRERAFDGPGAAE